MITTAAQIDPPLAEPNILLDERYQVIEVLSARLWTRTYLAQDLRRPSLTGCVIHHLKSIPIVPNYRQTVRELFRKEAIALEAAGTHAQIPQFLAWFEDEQGFYVVQEFVHGQPLSLEVQPAQRWSAEAILQLLHDVLDPLAWIHRHGSIHGNLKPDNLLRRTEDGQLMLIDLHNMEMLQRTLMAAHGLYVPPAAAAQAGYHPLEQIQELPCAASDVFALGMIAIQAWTGIQPVDLEVSADPIKFLWQAHLPPSTSPWQPALVAIVENMVQWELPDRYANADQVLLALQELSQCLSSQEATVPAHLVSPVPPEFDVAESAQVLEVLETGSAALPEAFVPAEPVVGMMAAPVSPSPQTRRDLIKKRWKAAIANPSLQIGTGGVVVATTFAAVGWSLLNSVDWSEQTSNLWQRVTTATDTNSNSKRSTVTASNSQWRQEWQRATRTFQQAETAINQGEWAKAKQLVTTMPDIPYWKEQGEVLIQQASAQSFQQLDTAFKHAHHREFTKALAQLEQIPSDSPEAAVAEAKIQEYREKQNIKAWFDLQRAYDRAIVRDFATALTYLYQIPEGTEAFATAQTKIAEYKQKRDLLAKPIANRSTATQPDQMWLVSASSRVANRQVAQTVDGQLEMAAQVADQQIAVWLQTAERQVQQGQIAAAIATLENVPIGTPKYAIAREQLAELRALLSPPTPTAPAVLHVQQAEQSFNPGERFRESQFILGRAELRAVASSK
ncbi:MAG: protein kinase [Leptolyngbyaceae cyanobacterium bins.349]|nr:protein kinase [Leptolyngbyaceae cyanobacterium bins.349]